MNKIRVMVLAASLFLIISAFATMAMAEESKFSGYASVDVMSNYVWRGIKSSPNMAIQPSVGIAYGGFSTNLWGNYDVQNSNATETDLTLDYGVSFDKLGVNVGYIYYAFDGPPDTQEVYLGASYDMLLQPKLAVYWDYDQGDGAFVIASIGHSFDLAKDLPLNLGASASYNINNKIMGPGEDGGAFSNFYNAELSASVGIPVTSHVSLTPKIAYSFALSDDAKNAIKSVNFGDSSAVLYGGVNLTLSF
jgi:uncharacterized protein (TIGR02001 family)